MGYLQTFEDASSRIFAVWNPPPSLSISEWADTYGVLTASSAEPGRWRTYPYQRAIMDAFCQPEVEEVVCMKSKRVGWTKIVGHVLGYHIHQDPCPVLIVQPTIADAEGYSKEEIQPTIDETDVLRERVGASKSRSSGNTITKKAYPGGMLHLVGANSPTGFRRITVRVVLFDEVDGYPQTAGTEGDQIKLGMGRAETYWNRKYGIGSTPTVKGFSRVERHFEASSKGYPFLACPHCGGEHIRRFRQPDEPIMLRGAEVPVAHLHWVDDQPETAAWVCPHCGGLIDHSHHRAMIAGLWWVGEHWEWRDGRFRFEPGFVGRIGFHLWAGYSMSPNATPPRLVREFLEAKESAELLTVFVNTVLGETWEERGEAVSDKLIALRAERPTEKLAEGAHALTLGADVQKDRIECEVVGWNAAEESWSVDYLILHGDPSQDAVWDDLAEVLRGTYHTQDGRTLSIAAACIDSGFLPDRVYRFCARAGSHVVPVKGMAGARPVIDKTPTRARREKKRGRYGVKPWIVGVDAAKLVVFQRLRVTSPGPGYCHFPADRPPEYFEQLTGEKLVTRYKKGRPVREWIATRARVEALDCRVYAYAALLLYGVERVTQPAAPDQQPQQKPRARAPRRSNFVSGWRR